MRNGNGPYEVHSSSDHLPSVGESSSSTSLSSQQDVEDDGMIAAVLSEEYAKLDGSVGRRLTNLEPVAHVPRINSFIPNISDASMDHQRLSQRLHVYGLYEVRVSGDGNCQFRAISDQLYRSPEYHKHVRKEVVKQLKEYRSLYEGYVPMKYKKTGEWGDHVTLQAAADKRYMFYRNYPTTSGTSARTLAKLLVGSALQLAIRHPRCCGAAEAKEEALVVLRKEIRSCQGFEGLDIGRSQLSIASPLLFKMTDHGALLAIKKNV
ncbi:OTU domain-containing protein [Tanacetum coccineum]